MSGLPDCASVTRLLTDEGHCRHRHSVPGRRHRWQGAAERINLTEFRHGGLPRPQAECRRAGPLRAASLLVNLRAAAAAAAASAYAATSDRPAGDQAQSVSGPASASGNS